MLNQVIKDQSELRDRFPILWIISEGSPGHISQSRGLVDVLCSLIPAQFEQIEVRQKGVGGVRGVYRFLFRFIPQLRPFWVKLCSSSDTLPVSSPDILVASGGKSIFFSRYLADRFDVPLVFCGNPAPYPDSWFDCILSTEKISNRCKNWIHTDVLMNPITPELVNMTPPVYPLGICDKSSKDSKIGTILIGGRSRSQHFSDDDWLVLGEQMNLLSKQDGWRWLIATSRRTGSKVEALLETTLDPNYILDAVWWSQNPRKVVRSYIGHSDAVFVSRDSMTMISESVCSGRPVVVFSAKETTPSEMIDEFIENLKKKRLIFETTCQGLGRVPDLNLLAPLVESPVYGYAQQVLKLFYGKLLHNSSKTNGAI